MPTDATNPFGARATLRFGDETAVVYRLPELARQGLADLDRLPFSIRVLLENALRHAGRGFVTEAHVRTLAAWSPSGGRPRRGALHAGARRAAGLHRRAVRGGPGRHARRDGPDEGRPRPDQPGGALRPGHRPLGAGRLVRLGAVTQAQRRARVRAEPRALPAAQVRPAGVRQLPRRAAGHRHRPPGEPRVPGAGGAAPAAVRRAHRLSRHAGRHRLAHDHDQRPRRGRLGRGRHRGGSGDAGPALLHAHSRGRSG